jgi:hypothetical protein
MDGKDPNNGNNKKFKFRNVSMTVVGDLIIEDYESVENNSVGENNSDATRPPLDDSNDRVVARDRETVGTSQEQENSGQKAVEEPEILEKLLIVSLFGDGSPTATTHVNPAIDKLDNAVIFRFTEEDAADENGTARVLEKFDQHSNVSRHNRLYIFTGSVQSCRFGQQMMQQIEETKIKNESDGFSRAILLEPLFSEVFPGLNNRPDYLLHSFQLDSMLALRFANHFFDHIWSKDAIACIVITLKEKKMDPEQNIMEAKLHHLLNLMAITCFEPFIEFTDQNIADAKLKAFKSIQPPATDDIIMGQVEQGSSDLPDFITMALRVKNDTFEGIPFILRCGAGMDECKEEIRIQLKTSMAFAEHDQISTRNEIVLRLKPNPSFYMKILLYQPSSDAGVASGLRKTNVPIIVYKGFEEDQSASISQFLDDNLAKFVDEKSQDTIVATAFSEHEIVEARRILEPLYSSPHKLCKYPEGGRGPPEADELCLKHNYLYHQPK